MFYNTVRFKNNFLRSLHYISKIFLLSVVIFNFFNNIFYIIIYKTNYLGGIFIDVVFSKLLAIDFYSVPILKLYSNFFFFKLNPILVVNYLTINVVNSVMGQIYSYYYYIPINFFIFFFIRK